MRHEKPLWSTIGRIGQLTALVGLAAYVFAPQPVSFAEKQMRQKSISVKAARASGPDFDLQGEYEGMIAGDTNRRIGVQVIALGGGKFHAVFLPGGLPGAGWDGERRIQCDGELRKGKVHLTPANGQREYRRQRSFSATQVFPSTGQENFNGLIEGKTLTATTEAGQAIAAKKVTRRSPTLGIPPPARAVVLLSYQFGKPSSLEGWTFGAGVPWTANPEGHIEIVAVGAKNSASIRKPFGGSAWRLHLEFRTVFVPDHGGAGRSNSGIFIGGLPEIQVLDSFGLEGLSNECAGFYRQHAPKMNMCLPPLSWQTLDVVCRPATCDGRNVALCSVEQNGVLIHDDIVVKGKGGSLRLQDHTESGLGFRNIWVVPIDE
jgi:hypothetical protein